jgi:hypothetical protein
MISSYLFLIHNFPSGLVSPDERFRHGPGDHCITFGSSLPALFLFAWQFIKANHLNLSFW